ncbi:hypothetical protein [Xanthomonas campestris]|uniref:hypothetical protein n=1 Tax=Xanthomonas campestris TaxID=339 RepID=UPI0015F29BE0|nr:hypothetical protein [Xanthomonas campestris]MEA9843820.1 hypothetical protein [Xanthomonas campestris pv. raphani]
MADHRAAAFRRQRIDATACIAPRILQGTPSLQRSTPRGKHRRRTGLVANQKGAPAPGLFNTLVDKLGRIVDAACNAARSSVTPVWPRIRQVRLRLACSTRQQTSLIAPLMQLAPITALRCLFSAHKKRAP